MSDWISVHDAYKPAIGQQVLILIPAGVRDVIESAQYKGGGIFIGAWFSNRGDGCPHSVTHWMPRPEQPQ